ncbi:MAG: hydrolase [Verrucomicrobiota bacterium]|nr:hydrolase [Verrucomicrobiota bacterium]
MSLKTVIELRTQNNSKPCLREMNSDYRRIDRRASGLLVIDIQERLLPSIFEKERVVRNAVLLIRSMQILGRNILVTEQYPKGIGPTVPEVAAALHGFKPLEKVTFSAVEADGFNRAFAKMGATNLVICGIEAHVCVAQTCLDLLERGLRVFVVSDAVSSRTPENWKLGLERMRNAGAVIVSTEMILFELLERAGTPEFKQLLLLLK